MLKIIVCDDDERDLNQIIELVDEYRSTHQEQPFSVERVDTASELVAQLERGKRYDIYILDIIMDEQDGISLGQTIRKYSLRSAIVYVTGSPEYAMGAFDVFASGYLLKPVEPQKFTECMDRIVSQLRPKKEDIYTFKGRNGIVSIELEQLIAVENVARVMHFYMEQGKVYESVYIRKPFEQELDRLLQDSRFIQPHKSFVVNMDHVEKMMAHDFSDVRWKYYSNQQKQSVSNKAGISGVPFQNGSQIGKSMGHLQDSRKRIFRSGLSGLWGKNETWKSGILL